MPGTGQKILFEVTYVNYAWGLDLQGAYVTADGAIYQYDYFGSSPDAAMPDVSYAPEMTEQQVMAKYGSNAKLVGQVDKTTLLAKYALLGAAQAGTLLSQNNCADLTARCPISAGCTTAPQASTRPCLSPSMETGPCSTPLPRASSSSIGT